MILSQRSTLLIDNYLQNQCLKHDLIKNRRNRQKQKKFFFQLQYQHLTKRALRDLKKPHQDKMALIDLLLFYVTK